MRTEGSSVECFSDEPYGRTTLVTFTVFRDAGLDTISVLPHVLSSGTEMFEQHLFNLQEDGKGDFQSRLHGMA